LNFRVLITDSLAESGLVILRAASDVDVLYKPGLKGQELLAEVAQSDALITRSGTAVTQDAVLAGQSYTYRFKTFRPGLFWYHSHMAPSNETFAGMYGPIVIENNIDLYHVPTVHKRYFDYAIGAGGDRNTLRRIGRGIDLHNGHAAVESTPPAGGRLVAYWGPPFPESMRSDIELRRRRIEERFGRERAEQMTQYNRNLILFPNLIINDAISVVIRSSFPVSEDYVEITAWALAGVDESPEDRRLRLDSFLTFLGPGGFGTPDDTELLESCQRAFANKEVVWSDISKGAKREHPRHDDELQIRAFWRRWNELMTVGE